MNIMIRNGWTKNLHLLYQRFLKAIIIQAKLLFRMTINGVLGL